MKTFIERQLKKVLGAKAHEPNLDEMSDFQKHEARGASVPTGREERTEVVDGSSFAQQEAREAMAPARKPMLDEFANETEEARQQAMQASEIDGSHLTSELADDSETAKLEALEANPHEPPTSEPVSDSEEALDDVKRANEPAPKRGKEK